MTQCPWIDISLELCIMQYILVGAKWQGCINAGKLCFRDDLSRGPRIFVQGHIVSGRPVTPPCTSLLEPFGPESETLIVRFELNRIKEL